MDVIEINKGVRVHFVKNNIFNTSIVAVMIRQPLKRISVSENIITANMLKRGTEKLKNSRRIAEYTKELWGSEVESYAMKKGDEQIITLYGEVLQKEDSFIKVCELIFDMMKNPLKEDGGFCGKYFEEERKNAVNALKNRMNDKRNYAKEKCREEMYGEVCGDGYEEDFMKCSRIKSYENYMNMLETSLIEILIAGDIDEITQNKIVELCRNLFSEKRNVNNIEKKNIDNRQTDKEKIIKMNVEQGRLCIGYKTDVEPDSNDIYALAAGIEILGGSGNSKLFANVREKKGLCYYVSASVQRFEGDFIIESGIKERDYEEAVKSIDEETEKIKKGNFSDEEFKNALATLKKKYMLINDSESAQLDFYANSIILNSEKDRNKIIDIIDGITKKQICEAMEGSEKCVSVFLCGGEKNEK